MESKQNRAVLADAFAESELQRLLLDEIEDGIYIVDIERRIQFWNRGAEAITGYLAQDVVGRHCQSDLLMHCTAEGTVLCGGECPLVGVFEDGKRRECVVFLRHRHGHRIPVRVRACAIHNAQGEVVGALELFEKAISPELAAYEVHCGGQEPTCAANREYGEVKLAHALALMNRFGSIVGWIGIELSQVEELDHRYGHGLIDAAMKVVAKTIHSNLDLHDLLVQWDRTGFRMLVHNMPWNQLAQVAEKLTVMVRLSTVEWWGDPLSVTVAAAAITADIGDSLESLEERIRLMLDECQERGGGCVASQSEEDGTQSVNFFRVL